MYLRLNSTLGDEDGFNYLRTDVGEYQEVNSRLIYGRFGNLTPCGTKRPKSTESLIPN